MLPPGAIFKLKIGLHKNVYSAGASPRTPLGQFTELPRPPAGFQGAASRQGRGGGGEGRKRGKGKGIAFPHFFFYNLTTAQQCLVATTYTRSLDLALQLVCISVCRHHAD